MSTDAEHLVKISQVLAEIFGEICQFLPSRPIMLLSSSKSLVLLDQSSSNLHKM